MNITKYIIIILSWFGAFSIGIAQQRPIVHDYTLGIKDGLLANYFVSIMQDNRGIIWMGSAQGLNRYDGVEIKSYPSKDYNFAYDYIGNIIQDPNGFLWLHCYLSQHSTQFAYSIFDPITEEVLSLEEYLKNISSPPISTIQSIHKLNDGQFYLKTKDSTLYLFDGKHFEKKIQFNSKYSYPYFKTKDYIISGCFILDNMQSIYWHSINNPDSFYCYKPTQKIITQIIAPDPTSGTVYWLEQKDDKDSTTLYFKERKFPQKAKLIHQYSYSKYTALEIDVNYLDKEVYLIRGDKNLSYYTPTGQLKATIDIDHSSPFDFHNHFLVDRQGGIWKRNKKTGGIRYLNYTPSYFTNHQLFDRWYGVRGIFRKDSTLFINPIHDLTQFKHKVAPYIKTLYSGGAAILDNKKGLFLVPTESPYLLTFDYQGNHLQTYEVENIKTSNIINITVHQDDNQSVWIGNNNGIYYLDSIQKKIKPYTKYNGYDELQSNYVYFFYEQGNNLWLGSSSGLYRLDKEKGIQERFHVNGNSNHYLPHNHIVHIHEDKDGIFWLASKGGGLITFNPNNNTSEQFDITRGLINNVIYSVYEDDYGCLWLSSNYGIMRFHKKTHEIKSYTKEHGLLDNEFNTTSHHQDSTGRIYFGSQLGIISFHPKDFNDTLQNQTNLLCISTAHKIIKETDEFKNILPSLLKTHQISLTIEDKGFELKIALLDYRNPKIHEYAYKIEGFDKQWRYQNNAYIQQNNLPYGHYQMHIKVKNLNGNWVFLSKSIDIVVLKPFYLQTWFLILAFAFVLFIFYLITKWRTQNLLIRQKELEKIVFKRTEKIAQQAEDLKALDKVKSRFFANITHELRTPLTLILGPVSKLLRLQNDKNITKDLTIIKHNGEHLLDLIEEILDLSKLEAHKLELEEDKVHLQTFVALIFDSFRSQAEYQGIKYQLTFNAPDNLYLLLDANKVEKIFNNLLSNAIKFTPANQSISLVVNDLEQQVEFIFNDTGQGIHPDDLPHIFKRFYQSKQPDRPAQGGTGIGLALVYEFTKMMNGSIDVKSKLKQGTQFTIQIPKQKIVVSPQNHALFLADTKEKDTAQETADTWVPIPKSMTILLVEDHSEMRLFITNLLDNQYNIILARNGKEGIEQLRKRSADIDLIISDVMMPEMDGFTMLQQIKDTPHWRSIPIIMLTARAAEQDKLHALTIGVDDYLTKPFSVDELFARVRNLIQNSLARKEWLTNAQSIPKADNHQEPTPTEDVVQPTSQEDLEWIKNLETVIKEQISNEDISIVELSKIMLVSERHFRRKIKKITGLSPSNLISEIRMKTARHLLEQGLVNSVSEVAIEMGFKSPSSFSRAFKKCYGETPLKYLKKR